MIGVPLGALNAHAGVECIGVARRPSSTDAVTAS
jgi:hypothetical protein